MLICEEIFCQKLLPYLQLIKILRQIADFLGAVHILRQPGEGGGVRQMLTIADEGGRGGQPKDEEG